MFYLSLEEYGDQAQRVAKGETEALPVFGGGARDIEVILWEMAQARYIEASAALAQAIEGTMREHVPMSPRAIQQAPFRVLVGANMPAVLVEMGFITNADQEKQLASDTFQNAVVQALVNGVDSLSRSPGHSRRSACRHDRAAHTSGWRDAALMSRRTMVFGAIVLLAIAGGWWLVRAALQRRSATLSTTASGTQPGTAGTTADARKITATLYFVSEDGMSLVGVQREVPFGEGVLDQARQIVIAQLAPVPAPLASALPPSTTLRALYVTDRGDAFVDLSSDARTKHTGGALDELFAVYAIVNALTTNLPAITQSSDLDRRKGSRHAGRTRRSSASAASRT